MKCSDLQETISLYVDGLATTAEKAWLERHLTACPLCRDHVDGIREVRDGLRQMSRPVMPAAMAHRVRFAVRDEARARRHASLRRPRFEWFQMRLMPLAAGVMTSVVIGFSFLTLMLSGGLAIDDYTAKRNTSDARIMISDTGQLPRSANASDISPIEYARGRMAVAGESPSVNPQGTLATLSRSLAHHGIRNDEIVVVADVFSNGLARIAEVVEPSQNVEAVNELEKALESDASNAPFVPAAMDKRSENIRVVLKFQSVEVNSRKDHRRK